LEKKQEVGNGCGNGGGAEGIPHPHSPNGDRKNGKMAREWGWGGDWIELAKEECNKIEDILLSLPRLT
jgi:hypothetical protein